MIVVEKTISIITYKITKIIRVFSFATLSSVNNEVILK